ncbi:snaclec 3-like [Pollicipes pollicipes]|uniref:snaclec 3-like n=1 Tax=Pollicipes pollicipes TaxID=41117 RepID=UPI001885A062|nr:snaclec 3-like [Pollicipes pollicipes]
MRASLPLSLLSLLGLGAARLACPGGWTAGGGLCYRAFSKQSANYSESLAACTSAHSGAVLPSIHDIGTNSRLLGLTNNAPFYTGLVNFTGNGAGSWSWLDGSPTDFYHWARYMPVLDNGRRSCVWVYEGDGSWSNAQCNLRLGSVLCQLEP